MTWGTVLLATLLAAVGGGIPAASTQALIARARLELRAPSTCTGPADLIARLHNLLPKGYDAVSIDLSFRGSVRALHALTDQQN